MRRPNTPLLFLALLGQLSSEQQPSKKATPTIPPPLSNSADAKSGARAAIPSSISGYSYTVVINTAEPVGGKHVKKILWMELNDRGDVALFAECDDGIGIWSNGAWIAFPGGPITSAQGMATTIMNLGRPSLTPAGKVRYRAQYRVGTCILCLRNGYVVDGKVVFEAAGLDTSGLFMPDNKVLLQGKLNGVEWPSWTTNGWVDRDGIKLFFNYVPAQRNINDKGDLAYYGTYNKVGAPHASGGIFVNDTLRDERGDLGRHLFLNNKADVAWLELDTSTATIFVNGTQAWQRKGLGMYEKAYVGLSGFNDRKDLLILVPQQTLEMPRSPGGAFVRPQLLPSRLLVGDSTVAQETGGWSDKPIIPGTPVIPSLGSLKAIISEPADGNPIHRLNNRGQVLFAASFTPNSSNPNAVVVVLATPNGMKPPEPSQPPSLLTLANLSNNVYSGNSGYGDFGFLANNCTAPSNSCMNVGLAAGAYANADQSQIVIAIRGTVISADANDRLTTLSNIGADVSFGGATPTATLSTDVTDAAAFVRQIQAKYPKATITLTGHSLGGAIAQLIGQASGLSAYAFNAPGTKDLYPNLQKQLGVFAPAPDASHVTTNYRLYGDQVSLFGQAIGTTVTLKDPAYTNLPAASVPDVAYVVYSLGDVFFHLHAMDTVLAQIAANAPPVSRAGEPNLTTQIRRLADQRNSK